MGAQWVGGAKVTLLSRSAKRPDTMSRLGLHLPQSLSTVSTSAHPPSSRSWTSKYLPEIYIPVAIPPLLPLRKRERDALLFRNNRDALHRAHRLRIGKTSNLFWLLCRGRCFSFQRLRMTSPFLKTVQREHTSQVNEMLGRDSLVLVNVLVLG